MTKEARKHSGEKEVSSTSGPGKTGQLHIKEGFTGGPAVKNLLADAGNVSLTPGSGRAPGEEHGNSSSILAWEIPWTEEPDGLQSLGSQKSWTGLSD